MLKIVKENRNKENFQIRNKEKDRELVVLL